MLVCQHEENDSPKDLQFTVTFEGVEETDLLQAIIDDFAEDGTELNFEEALHRLIIVGGIHSLD